MLYSGQRQDELSQMLREKRVGICCILETKTKMNKYAKAFRKLGMQWEVITNVDNRDNEHRDSI